MAETIFWWIFVTTFALGFIFAYTILEDLIRHWLTNSRSADGGRFAAATGVKPANFSSRDLTPCTHGYDSPELFRMDTLLRIAALKAEIEEQAKRIGEISRSMPQLPKEEDDECE